MTNTMTVNTRTNTMESGTQFKLHSVNLSIIFAVLGGCFRLIPEVMFVTC